ncbi:HigA family addiction module antitoxin [Anaerostipes sp.]|uniref:HigA family addiction module antitoxin n=1 Tax=Anaerostipes sp. TaxID=1872530 RepID=UPI0025B8A36C|nr:HigA family addiction module antitoxin [Anaerostipes sp.]MBS7009096.1 HigA family addiction module antidote protein [Anaerostipes sp.]
MNRTEYRQSIAFHPGEYIRDLIEEMELTQSEFAKRLNVSDKVLSELINCKTPMNKDIAEKLAAMMGTSVTVWLNLQLAYDAAILENKIDIEIRADEAILDVLDYNYFVKLGAVCRSRKKDKKIRELRKYLAVSSLSILNNKDFLVNFRAAASKDSNKNVICANAWVQTAINMARNLETGTYNPKKLRLFLPELRKMTLLQAGEFIPKMRDILEECGIALVFLPNLKGSGIHGAVKWLNHDKVLLAINTCNAHTDIFWFSFFHELCHVFQHKTSKTFIAVQDNSEIEIADMKLEKEADLFAVDSLIPKDKYNEFISQSIFNRESIVIFADKIGIHPGIVVGRLQHDRLVDFNSFNDLRIKYEI